MAAMGAAAAGAFTVEQQEEIRKFVKAGLDLLKNEVRSELRAEFQASLSDSVTSTSASVRAEMQESLKQVDIKLVYLDTKQVEHDALQKATAESAMRQETFIREEFAKA